MLKNSNNKNFKFFFPYPDKVKLKEFYKKKYFNSSKNYNYKYKNYEKNYFNNFSKLQILFLKKNINRNFKKLNLLDVGCGNGSFIKNSSIYFKKVTGIDFSKKNLIYKLGKNCEYLEQDPEIYLKKKKLPFNIIILNNVLEHVINPKNFLSLLHKNLNKNQYILIMIPNDFSEMQKKITKQKGIKKYWVSYPEHQNYFNDFNFRKFISKKFKIMDTIGDFPVELFLFVKKLNYIQRKILGKPIHEYRCKFLNYCFNKNSEETLKLYKTFFNLNISRNIIYLIKKK
jgi:2-polyprenyl-3-methyl-5-hydroxy-6-metoxy-1,4-benzoquinol methylase